MKHKLLSIGRFADISELPPRYLRKLDARGLLKPSYVDEETHYRYYDYMQLRTASLIKLCRQLRLPPDETAEIVQQEDPELVRRHLERHRALVTQRIAQETRILELLDSELAARMDPLRYECALTNAPAQLVAATKGRSRRELPNDPNAVDADVQASKNEVLGYLRRHGAEPADRAIVVYRWQRVSDEEMVFDVCVPITQAVPESDAVRCFVLPAERLAVTRHKGHYETLPHAYAALYAWIHDHGHQPTGSIRETDLVDSDDTDDERRWLTEIALSIDD